MIECVIVLFHLFICVCPFVDWLHFVSCLSRHCCLVFVLVVYMPLCVSFHCLSHSFVLCALIALVDCLSVCVKGLEWSASS